ncbi:MAG: acyltransferase family protein, partial [Mycobacteriales bacterium]
GPAIGGSSIVTSNPAVTSAQPRRVTYVPALDGMRGISLPGTIYTHFHIFLGFLPTAPWWVRRSGPFTLNIEMFFVLSGALITSLLVAEYQRSSRIALDSFYLRRSRRLGPALLAVVPLLLIAQYALPGSSSTPLGHSPLVTASFLLLFVGNWQLATGGNLGWLGPAWTLGIEEQFYLTWPAVLRSCLRRQWDRRHLILGFWTLIVLSSAIGLVLARHFGSSEAVYMTPSQVAPILLGCALGYALTTNADGWFVRLLRLRVTALAGLGGMVAISAFFYTHLTLLVGGGYVLYGASACLLIGHCMAVADRPSIVSRVLGWKPFVVIGQVSYEAYLVHCIVILAVLRVAPRMPVADMIVLDLALIAVISGAFYYFVEQPIRRHGWRAAFRRRERVRVPRAAVYPVRSRAGWLAGAASAAAVVVVAAVMVATAGHTPAGSSRLVGAEPDVASVGLPPASAATPQSVGNADQGSSAVTSPAATSAIGHPDSLGSLGTSGPIAVATPGWAGTGTGVPSVASSAARPPVPTVNRISPLSGPVAGGTKVEVFGTGFIRGATVYFGSVAATHVRVISATRLTAVAPAAALVAARQASAHPLHGLTAPVEVRTAGGRSTSTGIVYTYV